MEVEAPLFSYALRLTGSRPDAEDILQESLLRLFDRMQRGHSPESPRAYVFSIAHNLAMEVHRRNGRSADPRPATILAPDRQLERSLLRQEIDQALAELPQNHRSALLLREFGDLSYGEIALTLGVTEGQVKIWIHRGRKKLSTLLDRDGQYLGTASHDR
ncbi:MAG: RNA polymerase sigma factor [Candidatus Hydrogenedentes bacterium]|nr:RNA polymerase sigma factor [Candidatus Hydrogenedentota bacterium]